MDPLIYAFAVPVLLAIGALKFSLDNVSRLGKIIAFTDATYLVYWIISFGFAIVAIDYNLIDPEPPFDLEDDEYGMEVLSMWLGVICMLIHLATYTTIPDKKTFAASYTFVAGVCAPFLGYILCVPVDIIAYFLDDSTGAGMQQRM
ncbi:hypothetical protein DFS34DRAFT_592431 [Phlyctochytrium arcticum]|nr:hypothetical protein DFS34DRAFT_592431 [Phlyctochytrium arcticum]